ncbi:MAG: ligase-associated DNA damage response endonuclease PdeM [Rhodomicrobium sp.]
MSGAFLAERETGGTIAGTPAQSPAGGWLAIEVQFAGLTVTLDRSGAAYIGALGTLIVADLHLEKGSGAAARGRLLPGLDTRDTLQRLQRAIELYRPKRVICLGDSFHDRAAGERMTPAGRDELSSLCASVREWIWLSGNHDPELPAFCGGESCAALEIGGVTLRHEPAAGGAGAQIAGHLHPKVSVPAGGYRFSGPCFCLSERLIVMPAFGAYTGGLDCRDPAIRSLLGPDTRIFMLHAAKLWRAG